MNTVLNATLNILMLLVIIFMIVCFLFFVGYIIWLLFRWLCEYVWE